MNKLLYLLSFSVRTVLTARHVDPRVSGWSCFPRVSPRLRLVKMNNLVPVWTINGTSLRHAFCTAALGGLHGEWAGPPLCLLEHR